MRHTKRCAALGCALALFGAGTAAHGEEMFAPAQVSRGAALYAQNCSPCHGARMLDPNSAFDIRTFPPDQKNRFINSVTKGKNAMPPWGDLFKAEEIDALWAYVMAGEKQR